MIIRKLYKFENAHIVRGCTTQRCRASMHGHSYKVELLFSSNFLDHGQMVYDFGLTKQAMKELIDGFDHAISLWVGDEPSYITSMQSISERWVLLPVSPSAEQLSRVIFVLIDRLLGQTRTVNGEREVKLYSVIVHETDTGYAQCFAEDAYNPDMGLIDIASIHFSPAVVAGFGDAQLFEKLKNGTIFTNPTSI
ncbi:MAG: 6-carboxy-5,6,7,8-tetrahydropterin synthase [Sulfurovum sp. PC08-66]|nr:MAG: 6-carboxy-5,6,7,8-tetrahydropterin synthase [Sulfurovum sp. PC08-66]KIM12678.1 MAG: 6-carboxy-5,6,7,8-tetrahydropterin synthase [Sulfuricurvum sp. PC08-66]